jgi:hypothetical protein
MNKTVLVLAIITGVFFVYCKSAQQKEATAQQNVIEANQDLRDTKVSNANDWLTFKAESEAKIVDNEQKISKLKVEMNKPGNTFDGMRKTRIEKLEAKNTELKSKLNNYDGNETEWKTFKSDFNRDMNEIGNNIKDLFR